MPSAWQTCGQRFRFFSGAVVADHDAHALARERSTNDCANAPRATRYYGHPSLCLVMFRVEVIAEFRAIRFRRIIPFRFDLLGGNFFAQRGHRLGHHFRAVTAHAQVRLLLVPGKTFERAEARAIFADKRGGLIG